MRPLENLHGGTLMIFKEGGVGVCLNWFRWHFNSRQIGKKIVLLTFNLAEASKIAKVISAKDVKNYSKTLAKFFPQFLAAATVKKVFL